jgi:hypothetical protein
MAGIACKPIEDYFFQFEAKPNKHGACEAKPAAKPHGA